MSTRFKFSSIVGLVLLTLVLGCSTLQGFAGDLFGSAETSAQRGFRMLHVYSYLGIPTVAYTRMPGADPEAVAHICRMDAASYDPLYAIATTFEADPDADVGAVALQLVADTLMAWGLEVVGTEIAFKGGGDTPSTIYLAGLGTSTLAKMRLYRSTAKATMNGLTASGKDPTHEQWGVLRGSIFVLHGAIQRACAVE